MTTNFMRRSEAADYLRDHCGFFTTGTLARLAVQGGGPPFRKLGRFPVYTLEDLDRWIASRLSARVENTSQLKH